MHRKHMKTERHSVPHTHCSAVTSFGTITLAFDLEAWFDYVRPTQYAALTLLFTQHPGLNSSAARMNSLPYLRPKICRAAMSSGRSEDRGAANTMDEMASLRSSGQSLQLTRTGRKRHREKTIQ